MYIYVYTNLCRIIRFSGLDIKFETESDNFLDLFL